MIADVLAGCAGSARCDSIAFYGLVIPGITRGSPAGEVTGFESQVVVCLRGDARQRENG